MPPFHLVFVMFKLAFAKGRESIDLSNKIWRLSINPSVRRHYVFHIFHDKEDVSSMLNLAKKKGTAEIFFSSKNISSTILCSLQKGGTRQGWTIVLPGGRKKDVKL
jgi:hypothetical protein